MSILKLRVSKQSLINHFWQIFPSECNDISHNEINVFEIPKDQTYTIKITALEIIIRNVTYVLLEIFDQLQLVPSQQLIYIFEPKETTK